MQDVEKKSSDDHSVHYSLALRIGSKQGELTYILAPYGGEREGGDAQLILGPYLDLRFEQESDNAALNKDTDTACSYFRAAINGTLYLLSHKFFGLTYKKQILMEPPALQHGKLHSSQVERISPSARDLNK